MSYDVIRHFAPCCTSVLLLGWLASLTTSALAADSPNIVFVMTDDQAAWAMGAAKHPHAITPNIDRLVREARLVNAFTVTPVCSPSRASLMTSRYGSELGITDWINSKQADAGLGLDPATVTWPEALASAGYRTGLVGKWHLGVHRQFHPTRSGYQTFMGFLDGGRPPRDPLLEKDGENQKFGGYTYDILTDHAIEFLKSHDAKQPFALSLHYRAPHAAWLPVPEEDWAPFQELDPEIPNPDYPRLDVARVKRVTREYLASVHGVDRNLGRLLAALESEGLAKNTIVIFTSDHGYNMGHNGIWHKGNGHWILTEAPAATPNVPRGQRPNMYDHSLRVPAVVRWPEAVRPGSVIEHTVTNLDWYPTLLAMAHANAPEGETIRGRNLVPLLRGEPIESWDDDLYAEYSTQHQSQTHMRAMRTPHWKLTRDFLNPTRDEFYDLAHDPAEQRNLIDDERPEVQRVVADLHARIVKQMKAINDPVLKLVQP